MTKRRFERTSLGICLAIGALLNLCSTLSLAQSSLQNDTSSNEIAIAPDAVHFATPEELLDALDKADAELVHFSANMRYTIEQGLLGDLQIRRGKIYYRNDTELIGRQFCVQFRQTQLGDEIEDESVDFVFDGRWLLERMNDEHEIIKREVVRQGESVDPLAIDGPFPLPIGQSKDEVLKLYNATLADNQNTGRLQGFYELHLTPKDDAHQPQSGEMLKEMVDEITLWYDPVTLLPWEIRINEGNGDIKTVQFAKVEVNGEIESTIFETTLPDNAEGWEITVEKF